MPTTIEEGGRPRFPLAGMLVALAIWFGGMAAVAFLFDPAAVIVFAPTRAAIAAIAASDGMLLTEGPGFATATSERAGFVRRLYRQGAWVVWPSLRHGCFAADRFTRS